MCSSSSRHVVFLHTHSTCICCCNRFLHTRTFTHIHTLTHSLAHSLTHTHCCCCCTWRVTHIAAVNIESWWTSATFQERYSYDGQILATCITLTDSCYFYYLTDSCYFYYFYFRCRHKREKGAKDFVDSSKMPFYSPYCPQQSNEWDCGIYVLGAFWHGDEHKVWWT